MQNGTGYTSDFYGRVLSFEQKNKESYALTLLADGRKVLVRYYGEDTLLPEREKLVGALVSVTGKLSHPETARNPRCFDYRLFLLSKNIRVIVTAESPPKLIEKPQNDKNELLWKSYNLIYQAKRVFTSLVQRVLDDETAAIFIGMMFGETELMDDSTYDLFKQTGAAHILSVSGLHVGMVYAFVNAVLGRRRTWRFYVTVLILLVLYAALSNFSPTVMRAVSMIAVHIGAKLLNRRYDMLTGVFVSATACLAFNPLALFGIGFILSYTAAASLAFSLPFVARYTGFRNRLTGRPVRRDLLPEIYRLSRLRLLATDFLAMLIPMIAIQALLLPMTAFFFNIVPLTALPVNILVIALSTLIVPLGIIVLALSCLAIFIVFAIPFFSPFSGLLSDAAGALTQSAGLLIDTMTRFTETAASIHGGSPAVASPPSPLVILFYAVSFFLMSDAFALMRRTRMRIPTILALVFVCMIIFASPVSRTSNAAYTFVDVGQGDCLHIRTADGRNWLMDGGGKFDYDVGKSILLPYLQKNGVTKLDGIFASHLHTDHFKGLCELSRVMPVGNVYVYEGNSAKPGAVTKAFTENDDSFKNETLINGFTESDIRWLKAGDVIYLGKKATAEVLYPQGQTKEEYDIDAQFEEDENKTSLIIRFTNKGLSALMTGDIGFEGEVAAVSSNDLESDILKVGHHGSKFSTSEAFLDAVDPIVSVIQVGKNNYGHPTTETLSRIEASGSAVFRNDLSGAILASPEKAGIHILSGKRDFISPMLLKTYEKN